MKKALFATLVLAFTVAAFAPAIAADYKTSECVTGRFREPLCATKWLVGRRTVVIDERQPDVIFLPHAPYVIVTTPHG